MSRPARLDIKYAKSIEEIADDLGVSHQRVQQIIRHALAKLRAELERRGWGVDDVLLDRGEGGPGARMSDEGHTRI